VVPDAVRAALPPLVVAVHVWNPQPSARFIIVGGHVYHEGDRLAPRLRLVTITQSGLVVDFRGYLITLTDR
jgi:general secretion pathway protein B